MLWKDTEKHCHRHNREWMSTFRHIMPYNSTGHWCSWIGITFMASMKPGAHFLLLARMLEVQCHSFPIVEPIKATWHILRLKVAQNKPYEKKKKITILYGYYKTMWHVCLRSERTWSFQVPVPSQFPFWSWTMDSPFIQPVITTRAETAAMGLVLIVQYLIISYNIQCCINTRDDYININQSLGKYFFLT